MSGNRTVTARHFPVVVVIMAGCVPCQAAICKHQKDEKTNKRLIFVQSILLLRLEDKLHERKFNARAAGNIVFFPIYNKSSTGSGGGKP